MPRRRPPRTSPRSRQTGQSEPNISRSGPKASRTVSAYGRRSRTVQVRGSASVTSPESLQTVLGRAARARTSSAQGRGSAAATGGLPHVVEHEGQLGQQRGGLDGGGQLAGLDDEVVDESGGGDGAQSAQDVGAQQPAGVGFALDLVADADEPVAAGESAQCGQGVGDVGCGQVAPADDARDEVAVMGEGQELGGLVGDGDGLDEDGGTHPGGARLGLQVGEGEVPPERGEFVAGDPVLVAYRQVPHMVVGVDDPLLTRHVTAPRRPGARLRRRRPSSRATRRAVRPSWPARRR